jgi:alkanesulfonate monooxygenase SsuD/methylene tetrahydromethanopterin reductase-like flavin-dependent oxidoreductase (luciferase family)
MTEHLHLAVALEGYGWHPEAWRIGGETRPVADGRYWADLVATAERGLLDFVTFDDGLTPQRRRRAEIEPRWLTGRPDAVLVASSVATTTDHVGLIPVATVTHTTPSHVAKSIAALNAVSHGRAGWQPRISSTEHEAALFGRRDVLDPATLFDHASDAIDVIRNLWDDDAAHDRPIIAALAHAHRVYEFAARSAELVFITPKDDESVRSILGEIADVGGAHLKVYADVYVAFGGAVDARSDAVVFDGSPNALVELLLHWKRLGINGFRLRPAVNSDDLLVIVDEVVPLLQSARLFRTEYEPSQNLRARLGLPTVARQSADDDAKVKLP